jgi:hypothetical protein
MASSLVRPLLHDRIDIVGDIHGEAEALRRLLARLGCDIEHGRADRPIVFVGDLVDRGPDSVGVVEIVQQLIDAGIAQAVLGNHELNLLAGAERQGNGWFAPHAGGPDTWQDQGLRVPFTSRIATPLDRERIRAFFVGLPVALESPALRIVHAAWNRDAIEAARSAPDHAAFVQLPSSKPTASTLPGAPSLEAITNPRMPVAFHAALAEEQAREQNGCPVKVLTSGPERPIRAGASPRFVNGKWRLLEREAWWDADGDERPVIFGHYWRRRPGAVIDGKPDLLRDIDPTDWFGDRRQAFCIDYSVGYRFKARHRQTDLHASSGLAALRIPEQVLVFDDRSPPIATRQSR